MKKGFSRAEGYLHHPSCRVIQGATLEINFRLLRPTGFLKHHYFSINRGAALDTIIKVHKVEMLYLSIILYVYTEMRKADSNKDLNKGISTEQNIGTYRGAFKRL